MVEGSTFDMLIQRFTGATYWLAEGSKQMQASDIVSHQASSIILVQDPLHTQDELEDLANAARRKPHSRMVGEVTAQQVWR